MSDDKSMIAETEISAVPHVGNNATWFYGILIFLAVLMFTNLEIIIFLSQPQKSRIKPTSVEDRSIYVWPTTVKTTTYDFERYNFTSLPFCNSSRLNASLLPAKHLEQYKKCSLEVRRFDPSPDALFSNWARTQYLCDEENFVSELPLFPTMEDDKNYWQLLPKCKDDATNMLVLGFQRNGKSEKILKEKVANLQLFGTNPFSDKKGVYDKVFKLAIGSEDDKEIDVKYKVVNSGKVVIKRRSSVSFEKFFTKEIKLELIDMLWINLENGDFPYWDAFNEDGIFDELGTTVCQLNIEIARTDAGKWKVFTDRLNQKGRFIWLRPSITTDDNILSVYFLNVENKNCVIKYIQ